MLHGTSCKERLWLIIEYLRWIDTYKAKKFYLPGYLSMIWAIDSIIQPANQTQVSETNKHKQTQASTHKTHKFTHTYIDTVLPNKCIANNFFFQESFSLSYNHEICW